MKSRRSPKIWRPADAILTADLHLTEATPISRTDDYIAAQARKLQFLQDLSQEHGNCPILCAGDVFDHWRGSPWLATWAYLHLPHPLVTIPGNHDLPMHNQKLYPRSTLALMEAVTNGDITVLKGDGVITNGLAVYGVPFGAPMPIFPAAIGAVRRILLLHVLVWQQRGVYEAKLGGDTAKEILQQYGESFDLIVTGDNHEAFTYQEQEGGPLLVNPGSMLRRTVDQEDFIPQCYLYYAATNDVVPVPFPIDSGVHSRAHLVKQQARDERIAAYIDRMGKEQGVSLSFRANLQAYFAKHHTPSRIQELIWQHFEAEKM
jgi:hypothetical protein